MAGLLVTGTAPARGRVARASGHDADVRALRGRAVRRRLRVGAELLVARRAVVRSALRRVALRAIVHPDRVGRLNAIAVHDRGVARAAVALALSVLCVREAHVAVQLERVFRAVHLAVEEARELALGRLLLVDLGVAQHAALLSGHAGLVAVLGVSVTRDAVEPLVAHVELVAERRSGRGILRCRTGLPVGERIHCTCQL